MRTLCRAGVGMCIADPAGDECTSRSWLITVQGGRVLAGARTLSRSRTVAERFGTAGGTAIWSRSLRADNIFVQLKRKNLTVCADDDTSCYASMLATRVMSLYPLSYPTIRYPCTSCLQAHLNK